MRNLRSLWLTPPRSPEAIWAEVRRAIAELRLHDHSEAAQLLEDALNISNLRSEILGRCQQVTKEILGCKFLDDVSRKNLQELRKLLKKELRQHF